MFLKSKKNKNSGYTLVEVIVVISIMAVLTAIIYSSFDISKAQSRDRERVSDISVIQIALEQYFQKYGVYPVSLSSIVEGNPNESIKIKFLSEIPKDPSTNKIYSESTNSGYFPMTKTKDSLNCISYQLWTTFENSNSYLDSKKGFDSTSLSKDIYECGVEQHTGIDASSSPLVYDVMP